MEKCRLSMGQLWNERGNTLEERLQKIIAARGVASRRHAEELIAAGRVQRNGIVCKLGDTADPNVDEILLDGNPLPAAEKYVYIVLNKPRGFVTTMSDEKSRKNVAQLVSDCGCRVYPVGRLDMDSDGLLLMTNDGELANRMMHPKYEVNKIYRVEVKKVTDWGLQRLGKPISLDGYKLRIPDVTVLQRDMKTESAVLEMTIHEGRNRQVRRMCAIAGMQVKRLTRIAEGCLTLGNLKQGSWRYLTDEELAKLRIE